MGDADGLVTPLAPKRALGCEVRLVGAASGRIGSTQTSRCVGMTHTVTGFSSAKRSCGAAGDAASNPCGSNSTCSGTGDGYVCACAAGYTSLTGNGRNCVGGCSRWIGSVHAEGVLFTSCICFTGLVA